MSDDINTKRIKKDCFERIKSFVFTDYINDPVTRKKFIEYIEYQIKQTSDISETADKMGDFMARHSFKIQEEYLTDFLKNFKEGVNKYGEVFYSLT